MQFYGRPVVEEGSIFAHVAIVDWHSTIGRRLWLLFGNVQTFVQGNSDEPGSGRHNLYLFLREDDRWTNVYVYLRHPFNSSHPRTQWWVSQPRGQTIEMVPYDEWMLEGVNEIEL